jgi:hypothetical protein
MHVIDKLERKRLNNLVRHDVAKIITDNTHIAHRFIFDREVSFLIGEIAQFHGKKLIEEMAFIKPPFGVTYIELDSKVAFKGRGGVQDEISDITADQRLSYLVVDNRIYSIVEGFDGIVSVTPFNFKFGTPTIPEKDLFPTSKRPDLHKAIWALGGQRHVSPTMAKLTEDLGIDNPVYFPDIGIKILDFNKLVDVQQSFKSKAFENINMNEYAFQGGGDPLLYLAAMWLLNKDREGIIREPVVAKRIMEKGKSVAQKAHTKIQLHIDRPTVIRAFSIPTGKHRGPVEKHEVIAHWVTRHRFNGCEHSWFQTDYDGEKFKCTKCPATKVRRKEHTRGSKVSTKPQKEYEVHR